jgi:hypothetical protein
VYFLEDVAVDCDDVEALCFIHSTNGYGAENILRMRKLTTKVCKEKAFNVFNQKLIYLFYGKPSYVVKYEEGVADPPQLPVVLIFDNNIVPYRIFPFDTGGFSKGKYLATIGKQYSLMKFAMKAEINEIKKHIRVFFHDNCNYWSGKATNNNKDIDSNKYRKVFHELISSTNHPAYDDRSHTIEVQVNTDIKLRKYLRAVVTSDFVLNYNNGYLRNKFKSMKIEPIVYSQYGHIEREVEQTILKEKIKSYYEDIGIMI